MRRTGQMKLTKNLIESYAILRRFVECYDVVINKDENTKQILKKSLTEPFIYNI